MIKCNVSVIGTICRSGEARTDKDGKPFFTFGIRTNIPANQGGEKPVDISVAMNGIPENQGDFREGSKVKVQGVLSFRKKDDNLYLNLSASDVTFGPEESDSIKGTMSFKGTTGSKDIPEKKGKKGAYRLFDAFSSEQTADDQYVYTWVRRRASRLKATWNSPTSMRDCHSTALFLPSHSGRSHLLTSKRHGKGQQLQFRWPVSH